MWPEPRLQRTFVATRVGTTVALTTPMVPVKYDYIPLGPLQMYCEIQGKGRPLVLLHGGFTTIEFSFDKVRPAFVNHWRTIALEQQAHGRTADIDRPLSYEQMVADTAAALAHLDVTDADVFGWSDGGIIALGLAAKHPKLVRRVATIGAGYDSDAEPREFKMRMAALKPDNERMAPIREAYERVAPEPRNWPTLVEKVKSMYANFQGWTKAEMTSLTAPSMIMMGDADFLRLEHAIELFRMVPKGRLAVLPGSDHSAPVSRAEWVTAMLKDFFEAPL